jgi:hypothetical protein
MSALGQKRTFALRNAMSALSPESGHLEEDGHDGVGQNRIGAVAPAAKCR